VSADRSSTTLIVAELRRQVDHQLTAGAATDTKAAGLIAATFALVALVAPRVQIDGPVGAAAATVTFGLALLTLFELMQAIKPRVKTFSYGPNAKSLKEFLGDPVEDLEIAMVDVFAEARDDNEDALEDKAESLILGIKALIVTVLGLGVMLAGGAIA
jgi:hypothetical protein